MSIADERLRRKKSTGTMNRKGGLEPHLVGGKLVAEERTNEEERALKCKEGRMWRRT